MVERNSAQYDIRLREAEIGKDIKSMGSIKSIDRRPFFAVFNRLLPRVVSGPDADAVQGELAQFAAG